MTDEKKYVFKLCNYSTDMLGNWKKHLATKKHKTCLEKKEAFDINKQFYCKCCNYSTSKSNSWQRHIKTKKHISTLQRSNNKKNLTNIEDEVVKKNNRMFKSVGVHFVQSDLSNKSKSKMLRNPTQSLEELKKTSDQLLREALENQTNTIRRLGVKVAELSEIQGQSDITSYF